MIIISDHKTLDDPLTGGDCHNRLDLAGVKVELVDVPRQSFDVIAVAILWEDLQVLGLPLAFLASLLCVRLGTLVGNLKPDIRDNSYSNHLIQLPIDLVHVSPDLLPLPLQLFQLHLHGGLFLPSLVLLQL